MNADEQSRDDDECASLLAECDEALAQGGPLAELPVANLSAEAQTRLRRALDCLERLERAWPRKSLDSIFAAAFGQRVGGSTARPGRASAARATPYSPAPSDAALVAALGLSGICVPGYQVVEELGRGGMGVVYKATQLSLKRPVALKMILAGQYAGVQDLLRFRTEAEAVACLQHPNIVQIYEVGICDRLPFLALELVEGPSLAQQIAGRPQPPRQAAMLIETLARAIDHAHQRGVVHRDLKPANVLLTAEGTPKISDFGLAKQIETGSCQTRTGAIVGTPDYMAPEQAAGRVRDVAEAADIYALGAVLYESLTGRAPFNAPTALETLQQVVTHEPVPPRRVQPKLPRDLETICLKCLRKEPGRRYATAAELADDLRRFLQDEPIRARPVGRGERSWRWCRRKPALAALIATISFMLLAVAIGGPIAALSMRQQRNTAIANEDKAVAAERERTEQLRESYLAQARAGRLSGQIGGRLVGLEVLKKAAAIRPSLDLRSEAIGCMLFADLGPEKTVLADARPHVNIAWDARLERFAESDPRGNIVVRRVADNQQVLRLAGPGEPAWAIRFSPDGRYLAARHHPGRRDDLSHAYVWNLSDEKTIAQGPLKFPGAACSFYPGRARLAAAAEGQPFLLGERLGDADNVAQIAVAAADGKIMLHDLVSGEAPAVLADGPLPHAIAFDPTGERLAVSTLARPEVYVRHLKTGATLTLTLSQVARGVAWSDDSLGDGRHMARRRDDDLGFPHGQTVEAAGRGRRLRRLQPGQPLAGERQRKHLSILGHAPLAGARAFGAAGSGLGPRPCGL